jgi:hypothetical protein
MCQFWNEISFRYKIVYSVRLRSFNWLYNLISVIKLRKVFSSFLYKFSNLYTAFIFFFVINVVSCWFSFFTGKVRCLLMNIRWRKWYYSESMNFITVYVDIPQYEYSVNTSQDRFPYNSVVCVCVDNSSLSISLVSSWIEFLVRIGHQCTFTIGFATSCF